MKILFLTALVLAAAALGAPSAALAAGDEDVAALQVALRARGLYHGAVDGALGPSTEEALRGFQRRAGLVADGVPGPRTRSALGRYGRRAPLGRRQLRRGNAGWDVASLQFLLAWHGFPSGAIDGHFGSHTEAALRRFQRWTGARVDGVAGPGAVAALRLPPPRSPVALAWPSSAPLGDAFGPRGARFHTGLDFTAPSGSPVTAAAAGRVTFAGWHAGGWGYLVTVAHGGGLRTMYAHLSRLDVGLGAQVAAGTRIGLVGATGRSTGPHLHFEARLRGAAIDPLSALP